MLILVHGLREGVLAGQNKRYFVVAYEHCQTVVVTNDFYRYNGSVSEIILNYGIKSRPDESVAIKDSFKHVHLSLGFDYLIIISFSFT
jgi:hypothetical protein